MAYSKIILNGETLMDVTSDTVDAGNLLSGETATKNNGTKVTGTIATKSSSDLTVSGATVTVPSGYYSASTSKSVASGTAGTPIATKGTVSNNSVSVTPSVTNTTGYITGGTKTGTAVSVSASELVSGTKNITSAGTWGVTNNAYVSVPSGNFTPSATKGTVSNNSVLVTPSATSTAGFVDAQTKTGTAVTVSASELVSGTKTIIANGTGIDVTNYASVDVNVSAPRTATILTDGIRDTRASLYCEVYYGGTHYYTKDDTFTFSAGGTLEILIQTYNSGTREVFEDGESIAVSSSTATSWRYDYTLPDYDVDITLKKEWSATYGSVEIRKSGGSSAVINPLSVTQNGTYTAPSGVDGYSPVTVNVSGGGGSSGSPYDPVKFIDYDGTILYSYSVSDFMALTSMPSNPSHTGLTSQGWNWSLADAKAQLTAYPEAGLTIGQMYITSDGKTRLYVHMEEGRLNPYLGICPNGTVVIDWGDNSSTVTLTGTSLTAVQYANHTYATAGNYIITLTVSSGNFAFYGTSNGSYIFNKSTEAPTATVDSVYLDCIQKVELGENARINNYAFLYCGSLSCITIPSSISAIGTYAFRSCMKLFCITIPAGITVVPSYLCHYCYSLSHVSIPFSVTNIQTYAFSYCYSLSFITIPANVANMGTQIFSSCYNLLSINIPNGITTISTSLFSSARSLSYITIPSNVTSIQGTAFASCCGVSEYHLLPTTPPSLAATSAFSSIQSDCKIYVPSASLTAYQEANNWSTYADYMVGE